MENHKDLPPGAQQWARGVDKDRDTIKHLEATIKRLTASLGLDYRNPTRGINAGDAPSVNKPVPLKLDALQDVDAYNRQDGDFLMWSSDKQRYVSGKPPAFPSTELSVNRFRNPNFLPGADPDVPLGFVSSFDAGGTYSLSDGVFTMRGQDGITDGSRFDPSLFEDPALTPPFEEGKVYIQSFDLTVSCAAATPGAGFTPFMELNGGAYLSTYNYYFQNDDPFVPSTSATARVHWIFIYDTTVTTDGFELNLNMGRVDGVAVSVSRMAVFESPKMIGRDEFVAGSVVEVIPGTPRNLLAMGLDTGVPYLLEHNSNGGTLTITADGTEIFTKTVTSYGANMGDPTAFTSLVTVPLGAATVTLTATGGTWYTAMAELPKGGIDYYTGDTPDDVFYTYSWAGEPNNSASIRTPK